MPIKMPPIEKVYEAWSAIADQRVTPSGETWTVASSDRTALYTVRHTGRVYTANDNATYWQGYPGYPVLAVMMLEHVLPLDGTMTSAMAGIPWKQINDRHKRDYAAAAEEVFTSLTREGIDVSHMKETARKTLAALEELDIEIRRGRK